MKDSKTHRSRGRLVQDVFGLFMVIALLIVLSVVRAPADADDGPIPPPLDSLNLPEDLGGKRVQKPRIHNMTSSLIGLLDAWEQDPERAASFAASRGLELREELVKVMLIMVDEGSATSALESITIRGGDIIAHYKSWIDAWVPIDALESLAALPGVSQVREAIPVLPIEEMLAPAAKGLAVGSALTQGVAASNADAWHTAGYTGSGVKVAVIDSFKDYASAQAAGDLPPTIATYGTLGTSSRHGTAVAEIIYDIAPGVDFTFASPGSATQMASYIVDLAAAGNHIISSSIGYYNAEPGDGTGPVSDAINNAHDTYGTLYVQAAGNQANYHWDGNFVDGDGDDWHEFDTGWVEINQVGYLPSDVMLDLNLRWNSWPTTDQDYDFCVMQWNDPYWEIVAVSENWQTGTQPPTETILYYTESATYYGIAIRKWSADGTQVLDLMGHNAPSFQYNVSDRSLVDPATPADSFSVAAVDVTSPYPLENYSSWGPTHGPGGGLSGGSDKPRIAAFANVDTWAYGPGAFNGTSSATPHVSGAAALALGANPSYTPDQIITFLEGRAVDQGDPGYDHKFGAGRLYLGEPPTPSPPIPSDFDGDGFSDIGFFRAPAPGLWGILKSTAAFDFNFAQWFSWGQDGDIPVLGDYDGDGKADPTVSRPPAGGQSAAILALLSSTGYDYGQVLTIPAGWPSLGDTLVPADFDGDGMTDPAIWRENQGVWIIPLSRGNYSTYQFASWGVSGDSPVGADVDGDGMADIGFYRASSGLWGFLKSSSGYSLGDPVWFSWGGPTDTPLMEDYDGDGLADPAFVTPPAGGQSAAYRILLSSTGYDYGQALTIPAGWPSLGDTPVPADIDGDGKADPGIWRESIGVWIIAKSSCSYSCYLFTLWGQSGDVALPNRPWLP